MSDFRCPACRSFALVYPTVLDDDQPVACAGCGAFVSTYGELKQRANPPRFLRLLTIFEPLSTPRPQREFAARHSRSNGRHPSHAR
jgi:hypothetical protein